MSITVSQLIGLVTISGAEEGVKKLQGVGAASDLAGSRLALLAGGAALVAGAAFLLIGAKASQMAGDFQQGVNRLRTGAGDVQDSFNTLGNYIKQVAINTGTATGPLIQAMYLILSSGQRGAQAFSTLAAAAKGAVIEQANVIDVANVLSGVMTNYGTKVFGATAYMNGLITAVALGKITLQQLAVAMGPIDPIAKSMGVSFSDLAAAMTTQTNAMIPADRAATGLRFLMQQLENPTKKATAAMQEFGLNTVAVANQMKISLPGALEMIYNAAKKAGPEGSVPFNRAISDMVGGIRSFTAFTALTGPHMQDFVRNANAIAASMKTGAGEVNGWSLVQGSFNVKLSEAKAAFEVLGISLGQKLLPFLTNLLSLITPIVAAFAGWVSSGSGLQRILNMIGDAFKAVFEPIKLVQQAAKPLLDTFDRATAILGGVKQAMQPLTDTFDRAKAILQGTGQAAKPLLDTFDRATAILPQVATRATGVQQAFNPFIALFQGIATAIRITITVFEAVSTAIQAVANFARQYIWPILQLIGTFLAATFVPVWNQLVAVWNSSLLPSLKQLWAALQPLAPILVMLGGIILGVVIVAIGLLVGVIGGLLKALAGLLQGVATVLGGMVQFFTGAVQVISGIIRFFVDLATGNFKNLGNDLRSIWNGIVNMFFGVWNVIKGIFQGAWGAISGFVSGLVEGVIGFFSHLKDMLVGHSIVPDIVNGILQWFGQLPGKLLSLGVQMIQGLISGIWSQAGNLASALGNMVHNAVGNIPGLGGILQNLHILGYEQGGPVLQTGLAMVHRGEYVIPAGGFPSSRISSSYGSGSGNAQPIYLQINGYTLARLLMPSIVANIRNNVGITNL